MEHLVAKIRRIPNCPLRDLSDVLLLSILSESDPVVERVNGSIIRMYPLILLRCMRILIAVFEEKEANSCWYLLLSGRVKHSDPGTVDYVWGHPFR